MSLHPYRFDLIRTDAELLALEPEWRALYAAAEPRNPFLSFDWTAACRKYVCPGAEPFVLTAREDGRLVGVAPLKRQRQWGFRVLRFIGDGRSDFQGFLLASGSAGLERALLDELHRRRSEWDLAVLRQLAEPFTELHLTGLPEGVQARGVEGTISPYLPLNGDWKSFLKEGPSSVRRGQRAAKKLEKEGGTVERWTGPEAAAYIDEAALVEERSWKERKGVCRFAPGPRRELLRETLASLGPAGEMELWLARLEGKPIAFLLNFLVPGEVWYYQGAYDAEYRKLFPGGALHYRCIERAHQAGCRVYDFLSGDEPYKFNWTTASRSLQYRALFPDTPRGYAAYALLIAPRWRLKGSATARAALQFAEQLRNNPAGLLPFRRPAAETAE